MLYKKLNQLIYTLIIVSMISSCTIKSNVVTTLSSIQTQETIINPVSQPVYTTITPIAVQEKIHAGSVLDQTHMIRIVSIANDGTQGNDSSLGGLISSDGRFVIFSSLASNLVDGDTNGCEDVFLHDLQTNKTERISVSSDGIEGNGHSSYDSLSANNRFVTFTSNASNLVNGDTTPGFDVFVRDLVEEETTRVSVASDGTEGNADSRFSSISEDGRYVVFESFASNLIDDDTNGVSDVFLHDRFTNETIRISTASDGTQGNYYSNLPHISRDGRYVAFESGATNLVDMDTNRVWDIFMHDRLTGETMRVSVGNNGIESNGSSHSPSISQDGRYITFASEASNLADGDTNGVWDVFLHDRVNGDTIRVSVATDGTQGNGSSRFASVSNDGRYVAFSSEASNLVDKEKNWVFDIYLHDRQTGETKLITVATDSSHGNDYSIGSISADGRYVVFYSAFSSLVVGDTNKYCGKETRAFMMVTALMSL